MPVEPTTLQSLKELANSALAILPMQGIKDFANSAFTTSLVGALAGAFFGARAAQKIAERGKQSELLIAEFRSTNAAIMCAFGICNKAIAFKTQHAEPLHEKLKKDKAAFDEFRSRAEQGATFRFESNFRTLPTLVLQLQPIETLVFEKLSTVGRPLMLVSELASHLADLNSAIATRAELILELQEAQRNQNPAFVARYFGVGYERTLDTRHPDTVQALLDIANHLIFFSDLLCADLADHGKALKERARKLKLKIKLGDVSQLDFSEARASGVMPKHSDYQSFLKGFTKKPEPIPRWRRFLRFFGSSKE